MIDQPTSHAAAHLPDAAMQAAQPLRIVPLGTTIGARVDGVERAAPWDDATRAAVHQAFLDHHVLVFPGGIMDADETLAFARRFGEPVPELNRHRRDAAEGAVSRIDSTIKAREEGRELAFNVQTAIRSDGWHTDQSFLEQPAKATVLHAHAVPSHGGATWFCNTAAAHDALPEATRERLAGLTAVHGYDTPRARHRPAPRTPEEIAESPDVVHPLVRTHPESGRRALYLNGNRLDRIVELERTESDALLDELAALVAEDRFVYRHAWSAGDAVVWDNRCTMHRVCYDSPAGEPRIMLRVVTRGDRPR